MKKIMSMVLCLIMVFSLVACGGNADETTEPAGFVPVTDGQSIGEGAVSFPLVIVDKEGNEIKITVSTDKETVGDALVELGLVEGSEGEYGLYVTHVNGIAAIYEEDATYWGFFINDEYAMTGVDATPIVEGETYKLAVTEG